jgi:hypothetical protein
VKARPPPLPGPSGSLVCTIRRALPGRIARSGAPEHQSTYISTSAQPITPIVAPSASPPPGLSSPPSLRSGTRLPGGSSPQGSRIAMPPSPEAIVGRGDASDNIAGRS